MIKRFIFYFAIVTILVLFFTPFVGTWIYYKTSLSIGDLYTFGIADRKDFFTVWIALFGAIGIAINIYQNHRRTTNQDKQLEKQAVQIQLQGTQIELQSKSQRDSRFSKGVELLGNANESARTGAAYSLFFLAKDYPKEFAKPVFEVLCSHVRSITTTEEYKKNNNVRPSNEIQSILDLLFRDAQSKLIFDGLRVNLAHSYLIGANLSKANLSDTDFMHADLSGANLSGANLSDSDLMYADLSGANLSGANLSDSDLLYANLSGADLSGGSLPRTDLINTNLSEANLSGADLSGAFLLGTNLLNADLSEKIIEEDASGTNLSGAYLSSIDIEYAKFSINTNLDGVDISQIDTTKIRGKINPNYLTTPDNETNADSQ